MHEVTEVFHPAGSPQLALEIGIEAAQEAVGRYVRVLDLKPRPLHVSAGPLTALRWLREQPDWPQDELSRHYEVLALGFSGSDPSRLPQWDEALEATSGKERNRIWDAIEARFRADLGATRFESDVHTEQCLRSVLDCWRYRMIGLVLPHAPPQPDVYVDLVSALGDLFRCGVWRLWLLPELVLLAPRVSLLEAVKRSKKKR